MLCWNMVFHLEFALIKGEKMSWCCSTCCSIPTEALEKVWSLDAASTTSALKDCGVMFSRVSFIFTTASPIIWKTVGFLDPTDVLHLYALHYVYLPRINRHLATWKEGYIRHHIRTAGSRSPMQLFILGLLRMRGSDATAAREVYEPMEEVNWAALLWWLFWNASYWIVTSPYPFLVAEWVRELWHWLGWATIKLWWTGMYLRYSTRNRKPIVGPPDCGTPDNWPS